MHIQKVLNSSVVLVQDDSGEESILLGKGIGYGRKAGEPIERQPSDRVFLPLSNPDAQPMLELFSSIPAVSILCIFRGQAHGRLCRLNGKGDVFHRFIQFFCQL